MKDQREGAFPGISSKWGTQRRELLEVLLPPGGLFRADEVGERSHRQLEPVEIEDDPAGPEIVETLRAGGLEGKIKVAVAGRQIEQLDALKENLLGLEAGHR